MSAIPSKNEILQWISDHPHASSKRDIAKAFSIKGAARIDLKRLLKELEEEGHLRRAKKTYADPDKLPPVAVLTVLAEDSAGDQFCRPMEWQGVGDAPKILYVSREADPALGEGDRILARLQVVHGEDHSYLARLIRRIGTNPHKFIGIFRTTSEGGRILPVTKGSDKEWRVASDATLSAKDGELVEAELAGPKSRMGLPRARIVTRLGDPSAPKAVSLIAIHEHGLRDNFPDEVIAEADKAKPVSKSGREDLTNLPFVTIDPSDARDHDDACYAHADPDPKNKGGHVIWVAIADVAHYVRAGSALDREAKKRGNSAYFPDRVVPMLPDRLSGDLCSLHEGVLRPCLAVRMVIDATGEKKAQSFHRGFMRSVASLSYEEAQAAQDGAKTPRCQALMEPIIAPLFAAYEALKMARARRQPLDLDLPERRIILSEEGEVESVAFRDRLDAHRLIEEFMVLANVAAAETLIAKKSPLLFRVHEEPDPDKLDALRETAATAGLVLAKGQVLMTRHLNALLAQAEGTDHDELINISTLRSMQQAYYHPENFGHFGLALRAYAHFTSPIRRYADLIVHRALISSHGFGKDGLSAEDIETLDATAKQISEAERRAMVAERDTTDRYLAAYLKDRVGAEFTGRISGVARFGAFVKLDETGADGLLPVRSLGREFFHFDADTQTLMGADTGLTLGIGDRVLVRLTEALPVTGGIGLELLEIHGTQHRPNTGGKRGKHGFGGRRSSQAEAKKRKLRKLKKRKS